MEPKVVDTAAALQNFLESLPDGKDKCPSLYIDLEGINPSRHGPVSSLTALVEPRKTVHIVDVTLLGNNAFNTADSSGHTLKSILESEDIVKVFFDIHNDSDALFSLHGVQVAGTEDLQLLELASRTFSKRLVNGLAKCIEQDDRIGFDEMRRWRGVKDRGRRLFAPE
jgi:exonuclease 3'-5' domain-containing protein 1